MRKPRTLRQFLLGVALVAVAAAMPRFEAGVVRRAPAPDPSQGRRLPPTGAAAPAAAAPAGWQQSIERDLRDREYEVSWQSAPVVKGVEPAWHAPNRAHEFRTYFTPDGIRVAPRTAGAEPAWTWGLSLAGYGRGGTSWPVTRAALTPDGKRIDYRRGTLTEWYENTPRGLEQGFVLPAPPESAGSWRGAAATMAEDAAAMAGRVAPGSGRGVASGELVHVDLALRGDLAARLAADGQAIDFVTPKGARALRYSQLRVTDARGESLPAWMEGLGRGIRLVIDARGAAWPVTIDPLTTSPNWTAESEQAFASFGYSVGSAGDVNGDGFADVIVGAPYYDGGAPDEGRAYVYFGSASGVSLTPVWTAAGDDPSAGFGSSVGTAGDVNGDGYADVIVGAPFADGVWMDAGRAYVYLGSESGLAPAPQWMGEGDQAFAGFGQSVGTAGDVNRDGHAEIIVGAVGYDNGEVDEGRAYVYLGSASGPAGVAVWTAESDQAGAYFGWSVGTAGDVNGDGYADVIVATPYHDNPEPDEGLAAVYLGSSAGLPLSADWTAESDQASSYFGWSAGTAGDVNGDGFADVIVGAPYYDNGALDEGQVTVYLGTEAGLSSNAEWKMDGDQADAIFGWSAATAGDVNGDGYADVIVGAPYYDNGTLNEGQGLAYFGSASGLPPKADWTVDGGQASAYLGASVATAGDVNGDGYAEVIVGAPSHDNDQTDEGRAYVHFGSAGTPSPTPAWTESDPAGFFFGSSVAPAGDVNGDGYADVIVGVGNSARALVYFGSPDGLSTSPGWTVDGGSGSSFGSQAGTAGDVNGDGYADIIVGAAFAGRAYVYHGSASGLPLTADWMVQNDQPSAQFGASAATAGDVNGDGYADVIVGAHFYDAPLNNEGKVYVYLGSPSGLSLAPAWTAEGDQEFAEFGRSVASAGDVNGDGFGDVIVGAPLYDVGSAFDAGRVSLYLGSGSGLSSTPALSTGGDQVSSNLGWSVGTAGDINGDGCSEILFGEPGYANGETGEGRVHLWFGSRSGSFGGTWLEINHAGARFGISVAAAGDADGDGRADFVVGADGYDNGQVDEGRAFLYLGSDSGGFPFIPAWTAESDQASARFGDQVATAGDVNGDGYADLLVGARFYSIGGSARGQAYLYHGNGGRGLNVTPQQRRADDLAPVAHGGLSRTPGAFRLAALGRTPFGRGRVKLEWEVKPLDARFTGTGTERSAAWIDSGTEGASLNELLSGLDPLAYHWRVRLLYHPLTTPLQSASRWFTQPWNGWNEMDLRLSAFLGGSVWEDRNADGIRQSGEPSLGGVEVDLLDAAGTPVSLRLTAGDGSYRFELPGAGPFQLRFVTPDGYRLTAPDQGIDDTLDSDADPVTGRTPLMGAPFTIPDATRWSGGLRRTGPCIAPDEPIFISNVRSVAGTPYVILDYMDPNQPEHVTGYNVYRSTNPALLPSLWLVVGSDVVDEDAATPNHQWVDRTGATPPPGGAFYYQITAYNSVCDAEGPR